MGDHLPNLLTFARIALTPVFVAAFWWPAEMGGRWVVLALFLIAAITDYADGWIARRRNMESRLGAMLDPIADKLLIASALVMLGGCTQQQAEAFVRGAGGVEGLKDNLKQAFGSIDEPREIQM